jgi:plastocyanin
MSRKWRWWTAAIVVSAVLAAGTTTALAASKARKVSIVNETGYTFAFSPSSVRIHPGTRVRWTNTTGTLHHILFGKGVSFSKDVPSGASVSLAFPHAGTFHYHCTIHPYMKGVVHVT